MSDCLFCKIANKEIPANIVYENEHVLAFLDINPVNEGHTLVIPKKHAKDLEEIDENSYLEVQKVVRFLAPKISQAVGACGFNIGQNNKQCSGQVIFHLHVHIMPRFENDNHQLWHGQQKSPQELEQTLEKIKNSLNQ